MTRTSLALGLAFCQLGLIPRMAQGSFSRGAGQSLCTRVANTLGAAIFVPSHVFQPAGCVAVCGHSTKHGTVVALSL